MNNKITQEDLLKFLNGHLKRLSNIKAQYSNPLYSVTDNRTRFECLYDCLEVLITLETGFSGTEAFERVKSGNNEIKSSFDKIISLNKNNSFLWNFEYLKNLSPIENNQTGKSILIENEYDFKTIMDVLRLIRNNVRHGMKEYNQRTENILEKSSRILEKLVEYAKEKYIPVSFEEKTRPNSYNLKNLNLVGVLLTSVLFFLMFFYLFGFLFVNNKNPQKVKENCGWQYTQDNFSCW